MAPGVTTSGGRLRKAEDSFIQYRHMVYHMSKVYLFNKVPAPPILEFFIFYFIELQISLNAAA